MLNDNKTRNEITIISILLWYRKLLILRKLKHPQIVNCLIAALKRFIQKLILKSNFPFQTFWIWQKSKTSSHLFIGHPSQYRQFAPWYSHQQFLINQCHFFHQLMWTKIEKLRTCIILVFRQYWTTVVTTKTNLWSTPCSATMEQATTDWWWYTTHHRWKNLTDETLGWRIADCKKKKKKLFQKLS